MFVIFILNKCVQKNVYCVTELYILKYNLFYIQLNIYIYIDIDI